MRPSLNVRRAAYLLVTLYLLHVLRLADGSDPVTVLARVAMGVLCLYWGWVLGRAWQLLKGGSPGVPAEPPPT
jgi:hypothetical protein